jgi:ribosomal protein S27AE
MTDCTTQVLGQTVTNTTCVQLDTLIALTVVLIVILIVALGWLGLSLANFMDEVKKRTSREEDDDPLEGRTHQENDSRTTQLVEEEIAGTKLTGKRSKCPKCGLRLLPDRRTKEWVCINCGYGSLDSNDSRVEP